MAVPDRAVAPKVHHHGGADRGQQSCMLSVRLPLGARRFKWTICCSCWWIGMVGLREWSYIDAALILDCHIGQQSISGLQLTCAAE